MPGTKEQRCWIHKMFNVIDKFPARLQARAKKMLNGIMKVSKTSVAEKLIREFPEEFAAKYPEAVETLEIDRDVLLTFFDFPAPHWVHLRTPILSSRLFDGGTSYARNAGAGSRTTALSIA